MSTLMRWNPFRELEDIQTRLNRVLAADRAEEASLLGDWTPAVDLEETDAEYVVKADLPDVKREDLKVELVNGGIRIQGERKQEKEEKGKTFHRVERHYGQFIRQFAIPGEVDGAKVQAVFKDGVLSVTIPKSAGAKPTSIDVKAG